MLNINKINKYYNKGSKNELHVNNDISLDLGATGFVTFLGASGSGKTTLLNIIGGLDKFDSGQLNYENHEFTRYNAKKIDAYRKENVGYIFQNYLLMEEKTVYENLRIALSLINVNDKQEQKKRIEYALNAVKMYKYRFKKAKNLSGGQKQRVAIARTLIKNSKIILADEPTGNLDKDNTIEVMNILKKLSKTTLVILVTHNDDIAKFYADRIIRVKDGKIIEDIINTESEGLHNQNDTRIYLKDLNYQEISEGNCNLKVYFDGENNLSNLTLVIKNNTLFIQNDKKVVDVKESNIELIDEHYEEVKVNDLDSFDYDTSWYKKDDKMHFLSKLWFEIKNFFSKYRQRSKKNIAFSIIFVVIGIIIGVASSMTLRKQSINNHLINLDNYYIIADRGTSLEDIRTSYDRLSYSSTLTNEIREGHVSNYSSLYSDSLLINLKVNYTRHITYSVRAEKLPAKVLKDSDIIYGNLPGEKEIVISKNVAKALLDETKMNITVQELVGTDIGQYVISGITSKNNTAYYVHQTNLLDPYNKNSNNRGECNVVHKDYFDYLLYRGHDITQDNEVLVNDTYYSAFVGESFDIKGKTYDVVGTFFSNSNDYYFITKDVDLLGKCLITDTSETTIVDSPISDENMYYYNYVTTYSKEDVTYKLVEGTDVLSDSECIVNATSKFKIGDKIQGTNDKKYTVKGRFVIKEEINFASYYYNTYESIYQQGLTLVNNSEYLANCFYTDRYTGTPAIFELTDEQVTYFTDKGYKLYHADEYQNRIIKIEKLSNQSSFITLAVLFGIALVYIFLVMRTRIISEIKEIGIYRALGESKAQMRRRYLLNIFIESTLSVILGYILCSFFWIYVSAKMKEIGLSQLLVNPGLMFAYIPLIYVFMFLFGIIPVLTLLRKTPSEIISKYDI